MTATTLDQTFFPECRSWQSFLDTEVRELWTWFVPHFSREEELTFVRMLVIGPLMIGWEPAHDDAPICGGPLDWLRSRVRGR